MLKMVPQRMAKHETKQAVLSKLWQGLCCVTCQVKILLKT